MSDCGAIFAVMQPPWLIDDVYQPNGLPAKSAG